MLSPAMLRILRWLDEHPSTLEGAWDVPRSLSLEGIADGIGVVRSAPVSYTHLTLPTTPYV